MPRLFDQLKESVLEWRQGGYTCTEHPLVGEILAWQTDSETQGAQPILKFLREPQFLALETYWYIRLELKTPHIIDLYKRYYGHDKRALFDALAVPVSSDVLEFANADVV